MSARGLIIKNGRPYLDVETSTGLNLMIDQITQDAYLERRSTVANDNGVVAPDAPPASIGIAYRGKFFTRGCRGKIEQIQLYCIRAAGGTIRLAYTPHPCIGPIGTVTITPGATWGWAAADIEEMWNYDSLFIYVEYCGPDVDYGYDAVQPYDGHRTTDAGVTWADQNERPFIRVVYTGETVGDVPVSGIINNIPIPSVSSRLLDLDAPVAADSERAMVVLYGAGFCDYIEAGVGAAVNSHLTYIRVECDNVLVMEQQFGILNTLGHITSTPTVSLTTFLEDGLCYMLIHKRFEFRRSFAVLAYNLPSPVIVGVTAYPTLMV